MQPRTVKPSTISFALRLVKERAEHRPEGYLLDVLSAGTVDGEMITFETRVYTALCQKYSPRGLGDVVANFAQPVARALDSVLGTNIQNCGGCKDRQETLNKIVPF
ncbi:MAG: hypothetical protein JWM68_2529 [Verrucomicrobiales bacterium]|nr:hypothetical protein [Verrucomicrobiales bacterium]